MDYFNLASKTDFAELISVVVLTLSAGLTMPLGAAFANIERLKPDWLEAEFRHTIIAFGGGALLSAIALVLIPEAIVELPPLPVSLFFIGGGFSFMALDFLLYKINTPIAQLMAMLSDFIPESIALGSAFAMGGNGGILLAGLIALQNFPESFNAFRELKDSSDYTPGFIITSFAGMALLGPVAGIAGYLWLSEFPRVIAAIMLLASGGILYSVFQDIAPQAKLDNHWAPPLGAVLGFCLGIVGHMVTTF